MGKRAFAWITLASFLVFSWSCVYSWKKAPLQSVGLDTKISAVQTKSGEKIDFNKNPAARIEGTSVVGEKSIRNITIEKSKIEKPKNLSALTPFDLTTSDGKSYKVISLADVKDRVIILQAYVPLSMPLSDIDLVWIWKLNVPMTILVCLAPVAIVLGILAHSWNEAYSNW